MTNNVDLSLYNAPQSLELGVEESSDIDNSFDGQVELRSTICDDFLTDIPSDVPLQTANFDQASSVCTYKPAGDTLCTLVTKNEAKEIHQIGMFVTSTSPSIDNIKNAYRDHLADTLLSDTSVRSLASTASQEIAKLEYTRPLLNESSDSLVAAMSELQINSAKLTRRQFTMPRNHRRNKCFTMATSTPFTTVDDRCTTKIVQTTAYDSGNSGDLRLAEAAGQFSERNVTCTAMNNVKYDKTTRMEIMAERSESRGRSYSNKLANKNSELHENLTETSSAKDLPSDNSDFKENFDDAETQLSKWESRVDKSKVMDEKSGRRKRTSKPRVLTGKDRCQSLGYRRRSGQFVSMAEAILKFQRGTPMRFHSASNRNTKAGPLRDATQRSRKLTCPMSPALRCKSRSRRTTGTNQQEGETLEVEEARRNRVKPNPLEPKKTVKFARNRTSPKKTTVVSTELGPTFKEVPATGTCKKVTQAVPFSFNTGGNKVRARSEKKDVTKSMFHARPTAPFATATTTTKTTGAAAQSNKLMSALNFEERNNILLKKKQEYAQSIIEQQKQTRIFCARPASPFKPVTAHETSAENLRVEHDHRTRGTSPSTSTWASHLDDAANQENRSPNQQLNELKAPAHTEKRLKKRQEFDAMIRKKEEKRQAVLKEEEAEQLTTLKNKVMELRKSMQRKAQPMPSYKNPKIVKSTKPLTDPQSPAWSYKTKK